MSPDSKPLTRAEAIERAALLQVREYDVRLDLTGIGAFRSETTVKFDCTSPGKATFIEIKDALAVAASLNGATLGPVVGNRLELPGLAATNVLEVVAELPYVDTGEGMHRFVDPLDGEAYVGAYLGVDNAQRTFACFDQPDLKTPIRLQVTAPPHWTVVANSVATSASAGSWEFAPTPRVSPYLFALVAGPLHTVEIEHRGIPFTIHSRKSLAPHLEAQSGEIFEITKQCFDFYHEIFDQPYPFDSYGQAFVPELNWGAMESPGCITLRDEYVFRTAVSDTQRVARAMIIAHEMAHMWFGNLVTLRWWDDIWLNESFAEFLGYDVAARATEFTDAWAEFGMLRKIWGYDADQRRTTHPVAPVPEEVLDTETALANFDGISYSKGASALRQLVAWLGRDAFFSGVNTFFAEFAFDSATFADLLDHLGRSSGRDVHAWADAWLRTSGVDTLRFERTHDGVRVSQSGARPHLIDLGQFPSDGADGPSEVTPLRTSSGLQIDLFELPHPGAPLLLPNVGDLTFAKIRPDADSHQALISSVSALPDAVDRAVAWTYFRDLVRDAELDGRTYLGIVTDQLPSEQHGGIVQGVVTFAQQVALRYLPTEQHDWARSQVAEAVRPFTRGSGDLPLVATRALIWATTEPADIETLQRWLVAGSTDDGLPLDADLRWRIFARLAALDAVTPAQIAVELAADQSGLGQEGAARARAALPHLDTKEAGWEEMFGGEQSNYVIQANAETFWQADQAELLAPFEARYFPALQDLAANRGAWISNAVGGIGFPWHRVAQDIFDAAEKCRQDPATVTSLQRRLSDSIDDYRRALTTHLHFR